MKYTIFYSWQSDLPNNTNRGFIEGVINRAIKNIQSSGSYELDPSLDRDTKDIPGSPNISETILKKIKTCDAFVADISVVTGDKSQEQRPSPNPNVLIELGYAIALLGWEKIILFCNEEYGTDEDLPFDIRQHRRIPYKLKHEDPKAEIRKSLISQFKGRLEELLKKGRSNDHNNRPIFSVLWNLRKLKPCDPKKNKKGFPYQIIYTDSYNIPLARLDSVNEVKTKIEQRLLKVQAVDGSGDPNWASKVGKIKSACNELIKNLENEMTQDDVLISLDNRALQCISLSVENTGNFPANDIRVKFHIPDWLHAVDKIPDKYDLPKIPTPEIVSIQSLSKKLGIFDPTSNLFSHRYPNDPFDLPHLHNLHKKDHSCYIKSDEIYFWADRLLHKHKIVPEKHDIYLVAKSNAPKGQTEIKGKVFCSEYNDWEDITLQVTIDYEHSEKL